MTKTLSRTTAKTGRAPTKKLGWKPQTETTRVSTRSLRNNLSDLLARARYGHERIVITKNGQPAGVVISMDDFKLLEQLEEQNDALLYDAAKKDTSDTIPWDQAKAELGL